MARDAAPGIHHVWVNAAGPAAYYRDDVDRLTWLRRLVRTTRRFEWTCVAFCQMTTHVHLLLDVSDESLPAGMRYLNGEYSRDFNARHDRVGHLVRRRYGNRRTEGGADLLGTYAYVVLNAAVEGMCPRGEDWRWSSYATTLGLTADFPFVDASVAVAEAGSIDALRELVDARLEAERAVRSGHGWRQSPDVAAADATKRAGAAGWGGSAGRPSRSGGRP